MGLDSIASNSSYKGNYLLPNHPTNRLLFRPISEDDFEQWLPFFQNPITHQYWVSKLEMPEIECRKWYENQRDRYTHNLGGMNALIEKESGMLIGHAGLLVQTVDGIKELEVAYSLLPDYWNKGFATEAAKECINVAFENYWRESLISIISLTNIPSEKVARKNGMTVSKQTVYKGNEVSIFRIFKCKKDSTDC